MSDIECEGFKMRAFHGDPSIKAQYLARVRAHAVADEIIQGKYWENGRGCAIGCTIHGREHVNYEIELGIPRMLACFEDMLFERMALSYAQQFPRQFLEAIPVGADLSKVGWKFLYWLLTEELTGRDDPRVMEVVSGAAIAVSLFLTGHPRFRNTERPLYSTEPVAEFAARAADDAFRVALELGNVVVYAADTAAHVARAVHAAAYICNPPAHDLDTCIDSACIYAVSALASAAGAAANATPHKGDNQYEVFYARMADKLLSLLFECEVKDVAP